VTADGDSSLNREARPFLTVGIATFNRSNFLADMIRSVTSQAERFDLLSEVEIVVSDNASIDNTRLVVESLQAKTAVRIRYHVNESNLGPNRNVARTLELAQGRYWMFYGDDDLMADDALPAVLVTLRGHPDASAFIFAQQGATIFSLGAATARTLTIEEVARDFFYYVGNAGVTALKAADAQSQLSRFGIDRFRTWWPLTNLAFMAMAFGRSPQPGVVTDVASSRSPHHADNTVYSSWYVWETTFYSLLRTAEELRGMLGDPFYRSACAHLFGRRRMLDLARTFFLYTTMMDLPEDLALSRRATRRSLRTTTRRSITPLASLWLIAALPTPVKRAMLWTNLLVRRRRKARAHWAKLCREAAEHRERRAAALAGEGPVRVWSPDDV
jgi:glycosyltransferase involved in cell wall biosynthesis